MKIIFVRHAEPDYSIDSLTSKGFREAELLVKRSSTWKIDRFYCSPLGRARDTAAPTLAWHRAEATVYDWLREFHAPCPKPYEPETMYIPWDFPPEYLNANPVLYDPNHWWEAPILSGTGIKEEYDRVINGFDSILAEYGYRREGLHYVTDAANGSSCSFMEYNDTTITCQQNAPDEPVIAVFCHLGVMMVILSHLMNTSPYTLWHGIFVPPCSVTVVSAEERVAGNVLFRAQLIGDESHLREQGEPISYYGGFANPFML